MAIVKVIDDECNRSKKYTVFEIVRALSRVIYNYNNVGLMNQQAEYNETSKTPTTT